MTLGGCHRYPARGKRYFRVPGWMAAPEDRRGSRRIFRMPLEGCHIRSAQGKMYFMVPGLSAAPRDRCGSSPICAVRIASRKQGHPRFVIQRCLGLVPVLDVIGACWWLALMVNRSWLDSRLRGNDGTCFWGSVHSQLVIARWKSTQDPSPDPKIIQTCLRRVRKHGTQDESNVLSFLELANSILSARVKWYLV